MTDKTKVEPEQEDQEDREVSGLRASALREVPEMIRVLRSIATDLSGAGGPRVAAARSLCEVAGLLDKSKMGADSPEDVPVSQMSLQELEDFILKGKNALQT